MKSPEKSAGQCHFRGNKNTSVEQGEVDAGDSTHREGEQQLLQEQLRMWGQIRLSQRMVVEGDLTLRSSRHLGALLPGRGAGWIPVKPLLQCSGRNCGRNCSDPVRGCWEIRGRAGGFWHGYLSTVCSMLHEDIFARH